MKLKFLTALIFCLVFTFWPLTVAQADSNGLKVEAYTFDASILPDRQAYTLCESGWTSAPNIDADWGGDVVAGCQGDFVLLHYSGYITSPKTGLISFTDWSDDGFWMSLDGVPVIDAWTLKGCSPASGQADMIQGVSQKIDVWFYEYGGGACNRLFWDAENGMNIIPASAFYQDVAVPVPTLSKPFDLTGVADGTNVDLEWSSFVEDTPIERYAVSWTYGGADGWGVASVDPYLTVAGLPANTDVTFRVRADNDTLGIYSEYSDPITVRTGEELPVIVPTPQPTVPVVIPEPPIVPEPPVVEPVTPVPPVIPDVPVIEPVTPVEPSPTPEPVITAEPPVIVPEPVLSPAEEHQALLDNLLEQAQADDIEVPENLAAIPVLGATIVALTDALNFMGNVGADMSPEVRAKAKKEVIAAVVLTQISQFATSQAVASAQVSASSGASGSSKTRRNKE
jgi:hypothetical protein